jgi:spore coat polysaccharide biosynthesis protein SpsF
VENPKVLLIVQARMGSTRLPGKVMLPLMGEPILHFLINRLQKVKLVAQIVIATTEKTNDDVIAEFCESSNIACFRGSEDDVLSRYKAAADAFGGQIIVRITSDCPLIDPALIDLIIVSFLMTHPPADYVSNTLERTYPRGMDVEVFSYESLAIADKEAKLLSEREHVTPFIYNHPDRFKIKQVRQEEDTSSHRWTLDTPEDYRLITLLAENLYPKKPNFNLEDLTQLISKHSDWSLINSHIAQKRDTVR